MQAEQNIRRVVLTGGPGAGKTALLRALRQLGFETMPDTARAIIQNRRQNGLPPRPDPVKFAQEILKSDIRQYELAQPGPIFYDRCILDALGMLDDLHLLSDPERKRLLALYPYHPEVFILPPWREIYKTDAERDQTYEEAVEVYDRIREWYSRCGYSLVEVAPAPVEGRCEFVLRRLRQ